MMSSFDGVQSNWGNMWSKRVAKESHQQTLRDLLCCAAMVTNEEWWLNGEGHRNSFGEGNPLMLFRCPITRKARFVPCPAMSCHAWLLFLNEKRKVPLSMLSTTAGRNDVDYIIIN